MNRERRILVNVVILVMVVCMLLVSRAGAVGTAFTYQGRLSDANSPAEGFYDFEFELFDQDAGGNQFGNTVTKDEVEVINGYFTTMLDFVTDANVFNGDLRWLAIAVRPGPSSDPCDFATLSPRQEVTPTPYAMYSGRSQDADTLDSFDSVAFAPSVHDHDGIYAFMAHSHDGVYALISHNHDDRYYTETQLGLSGEAIVHWDNLSNTPAGLADGDDVGLTVETDPTVAASVKDGVSWAEITSIPADIADGDDDTDTQLTEGQVDTYVANNGYLDGASALDWDNITIDIPAGFADDVDDVGGPDLDWTIDANDMYAAVSGNVGIGTTSPVSWAKLDVAGKVKSQNTRAIASTTYLVSMHENTYQDVPDMSVTVTTGNTTVLIIACLGGTDVAATGVGSFFRILVDGVQKTETFYETEGQVTVGNVLMVWLETMTEGTHTIKVQWRSEVSGAVVKSSRNNATLSILVLEL